MEKYKVLIADDEYWTREKLKKMIHWEEYSFELLEMAEDGEDVLRKMEKEPPHILITDINMPYLNGVELLKIVKERYPDVVTFVISGYDDFQYVKDSFMAGTMNYLLKPVSKMDLVNTLSKALELISEKQSRNLELRKASSLVTDREYSRLLERQNMPLTPNITMNRAKEFVGASLILIKIHNMYEMVKRYQYDQNLLALSVKETLRNITGEHDGVIIFNHIYRANEFLLIIEKDWESIQRMVEKIAITLGREASSPITIVISEHSFSMDSIHQAYTQIITALMTRYYRKENQIITCASVFKSKGGQIENKISEAQAQELKQILRKRNASTAKKDVSDLLEIKSGQEQWTYLEVRQTVKKIMNLTLETFAAGMTPEEMIAMENFTDLVDKVTDSLDGECLMEIIGEAVDFAISTSPVDISETTRGIVHQAVEYINQNYFEQITLSSLSEQYHVESSYFSRLFRQETGENVMLYIAKTRIEKAKEYISKGNISLTEIAFLTGYDDYTYFNRVFRKITGKSPRDYRTEINANSK